MDFNLTDPCTKCLFRADGTGFTVSPERANQMACDLLLGDKPIICPTSVSFDCTGHAQYAQGLEWCAGALILLDRFELTVPDVQQAIREGRFDPSKLNKTAPIYETFGEFVLAMGPPLAKRRRERVKKVADPAVKHT